VGSISGDSKSGREASEVVVMAENKTERGEPWRTKEELNGEEEGRREQKEVERLQRAKLFYS
jgi:hypothetical protein